jgi:P2-related tail formation protein
MPFTKTSFRKTTGDAYYKSQYKKATLSTLKELIKKIERNDFEVTSFGWWPEATPNKFTFQVHVKNPEES